MESHIIDHLLIPVALLAGGTLGVSFGILQALAWRRHQALQHSGKFDSGWAAVPGSFRRVACLLLALILIELLCPLLFTSHLEWWVSGGVVGGYGSVLFWHLRRKLTNKA